MNKPINLFTVTFIAIISVYLFVLGENKTLQIIKEDYLYILSLIPIAFAFFYFKFKLKDYEIINFNKNSDISLKSTILFFLVFQVYDYYSEGGFIGMISQWFIYWIMGIIALLLLETINYYKNYKLLQKAD
ncbi:ABC transporter, permease protein, putative [Arcobacter nitrofigilis DSM 7299]|uniref:ABC transporter, permease protein, putative n=1 Tax=Arcobacter nitrofigilis (strain ATCC 33309 / DSM 7299 / CCUG 15893 / LMG 7604 / NCTC 12251 / CI) TaxID=572480 RepID=D5V035_ARCNC|nr:hypothetical protein [Arcobacter nitrofigilis]ADG93647.1 ABC transporter, permease protein, putative [Arcobacter nitrofigilis DSM 7299]